MNLLMEMLLLGDKLLSGDKLLLGNKLLLGLINLMRMHGYLTIQTEELIVMMMMLIWNS